MKYNYAQFKAFFSGKIGKMGQFFRAIFDSEIEVASLKSIIWCGLDKCRILSSQVVKRSDSAGALSYSFVRTYITLVLALVLGIWSFTAKAQLGQQVINGTPGDIWSLQPSINTNLKEWVLSNPNLFPATPNAHRNGLRIDISQKGSFRVYDDYRENFAGMVTYIRFGSSRTTLLYNDDPNGMHDNLLGDACSTSPVGGSGTATDPWIVLNVFKVTSPTTNRIYNLYQRITYVKGNPYFFIDFEVVGDQGAQKEEIHIYVAEDTYPGGCDNGNGYVDKATNPTVVAGIRGGTFDATKTSTGAYCVQNVSRWPTALVYKASAKGFTSYYSGLNPAQTGINNSLGGMPIVNSMLPNTNDATFQDHGLAVHFDMGQLGASEGVSRRLMLGYGSQVSDFDDSKIQVVDQTSKISGSTPVSVSFVSNTYNVSEGDISDTTDPQTTVQGVKVHVQGGVLNDDIPILIQQQGGSFPANGTSLISGFVIPKGDYNTSPRDLDINNLRIAGNLLNEQTDLGDIKLALSGDCATLALVNFQGNTTTDIHVQDDDDISIEFEKIQDGAEQGLVPAQFRVKTHKAVTSNNAGINVTLDYTGSTAQAPRDVVSLPTSCTISVGQTSTIVSIPVVDNHLIEGDLIIKATGTVVTAINGNVFRTAQISPTANSVTLTISDGDNTSANLILSISPSITTIDGGTSKTLTVNIPASRTFPVTVTLSQVGGNAILGTNYTGLNVNPSTQVVIPAYANSASFTITGLNTGIINGTSALNVQASATGYTAGSGTITINDKTGVGGSVSVTISNGIVSENQAITLTASLPSGITTANPLTVTITPAPGFLSGYTVNGVPVTVGPFNVVIPVGAGSISFVVQTTFNNSIADKVYSLGGTATDGVNTFTVNSGTLTVTSSGLVLHVDNSVTPTVQVLGGSVTYTTVISNIGVHNLDAKTGLATFLINVSGVDLSSGANGIVFTSEQLGGSSINYVSGNGGSYTYTVGNLPVGGSLTLTYVGAMSSTAPSGVNVGHILPPPPYVNNDVHRGYGAAQTFLMPVMIQPYDDHTCSGVALNKGFSATPTVYTTYSWTRTDNNANVSTTSFTSPGTVLMDVLTNSTSLSQTVNYSITPQITATKVQYDGSSSGNVQNTLGVGKLFSVLVKDKGVTGADPTAITMNYDNKNGVLVLTPIASSVVHPKFKWYNDAQGTGGSINDGSIDPVTGARSIPIVPPLHVGDTYTWYASVSGDNTCESVIESKSLVIPPVPQPISLTFVNASGGSITSVNGGVPTGDSVYIIASLPAGITATVNGVKVWLTPNVGSSTAINGTDYTNWISTAVVIPGGANTSAITRVFDAKNRGSIGLSTTLIADASYTTDKNYYIASGSNSPTIKIIDTTGNDVQNRVITVGSGVVTETLSKTLTVSLPNTPLSVTTSAPISVTIISNKVFPGGYGVDVGSGVQSISGSTSFTVVIPANSHSVSYTIYTANDGIYVDNIFNLSGTAIDGAFRSYRVVAGTLTVTNTEVAPPERTIKISSSSVEEPNSVNLTASLASGVAGSSGLVVSLNVSPNFPSGYSIPSSVTIPVGQSSVNIPISTVSTGSTQALVYNINGSASGYAVSSGSLTVIGSSYPKDKLIRISSSSVEEPNSVNLTASLASGVAGSGGLVVSLNVSPNFPSGYSIPSSVTIPVGQSSVNIPISTVSTGSTQALVYNINGSASGYTVSSGSLTVIGSSYPKDKLIRISSASVEEPNSVNLTASLASGVAGSGGLVVSLNVSPNFPSGYSIPSSVTIPVGQSSVNIPISTVSTGSTQALVYNINGSASGYTVSSGSLTVIGSSYPKDKLIRISSASVEEPNSVNLTASLASGVAGSGGLVVSLNVSPNFPSGYSIPSSVTIPVGQSSVNIPISTVSTGSTQALVYNINGSASGYTVSSGSLTVIGSSYPKDKLIRISSASVEEPNSVNLTASLASGVAGSGGLVVSLNVSPNFPSGYSIPSSVTIPVGQSSVNIPISTVSTGSTQALVYNINGIASGYTVSSGSLTVIGSSYPKDKLIRISSASVEEPNSVNLTASLASGVAGSGGLVVSLNVSPNFPSGYSIPSSVTIPVGQSSVNIPISTVSTGSTQALVYNINGIASGYTVSSGSLTVIGSSYPKDKLIRISSSSVEEPNSVNLTASLASGVAGSGGLVVSLNVSPNFPSGYSIPSSVTIPVGQSSVNIPISTVSTGSTQALVYNINGIASGYTVSSGSLTVIGSSYPKDKLIRISSASVEEPNSVNLTASLASGVAGSGGLVVSLNVSPNFPSGYSIPSSVTIPVGQSSVNIPISTVSTGSTQALVYNINGSASGYTVSSGSLTVIGSSYPKDKLIRISSASVEEPNSVNLTASLASGVAGSGGLVVSLNVSPNFPSGYSIPSSVTIPSGQSSVNIPISTVSTGSTQALVYNINGIASGYTVSSGSLTVIGSSYPKDKLIRISSASVEEPNSVNLTASLASGVAGSGGLVVSLNVSPNFPSGYSIPSSVTIPSGQSSVNIPISTVSTGSTQALVYNINGIASGYTVSSGSLTVIGSSYPKDKLIRISSASVEEPNSVNLTASLASGVAGSGGLVVSLNVSPNFPSGYSIPSSVTIPVGQSSVNIPISTVSTGSTQALVYNINGIASGYAVSSGSLTVIGSSYPKDKLIRISSASVEEPNSVNLTASLASGVAGSGGLVVSLNVSPNFPSGYSIPSSVTIPVGQSSVNIPISTVSTGSTQALVYNINGSASGYTVSSGSLTVIGSSYPKDKLIRISSSSVEEPNSVNLTASLASGVAGSGGLVVSLSVSPNFPSGYSIPSRVTIPVGQSSVNIPISTVSTGSTQALVYNINGIASGYTVSSGSLTVIGSSYPKDKLIRISSASVEEPNSVNLTASLASGVAGSGGLVVSLNVSPNFPSGYSIPSRVTIPSGQSSVNIPISTVSTGSTQALVYNINGIASGYTVSSGSLTVIGSSYPKDKLIRISSASVEEPNSVNLTASLASGVAGSGGLVVSLNVSPNFPSGYSIPSSVTIPVGQSSVNIPISTVSTGSTQALVYNINGSASGYAVSSGSLTVIGSSYPKDKLIRISSSSVEEPNSVNLTASLASGVAGSGGLVVSLNVSPNFPSGYSIPSSVTIPVGQSSVNIPISTVSTGSTQALVYNINGSASGYTVSSGSLTVIGSSYPKDKLIRISSASVEEPNSVNLTASLASGVAGSGGLVVSLNVSPNFPSGYSIPSSVTIPVGQSSVNIPISTVSTGSTQALVYNINGSASGYAVSSGSLTVIGSSYPKDKLIRISSASVEEPNSVNLTASLASGVAGSGGLVVSLNVSPNFPSGYSIPSSVTIPVGQSSVNIPISTVSTGSTQALVYNINGIASGYTVSSGSLTVIGSSYPKDKLIRISSASVEEPNSVNLTASLASGVAGSGGLVVSLNVSPNFPSGYSIPSSVTIPSGQSSVNIPISTVSTGSTQALVYNINGSASGYAVSSGSLTVIGSSYPKDKLIRISSASVEEPNSVNLTASLASGVAGSGGLVVSLNVSPNFPSGYSIPSSVTIPVGQSSVNIPISTVSTGSTQALVYNINGSASGYTVSSGSLTVIGSSYPKDKLIRISSSSVEEPNSVNLTASLASGVAGSGGLVVSLNVSPNFPSGYSIPSSVTIPVGQSSVNIPISTVSTGSTQALVYNINGIASGYTVSSGSLTVIGSSYPKDKLIRISSASVEEPNSVNLTASLASGVAGSGGLVVSLNVSPNFPSGYSIPSSVTIPVGQSSVNIPISTVSTGSTQALVYNINGSASGYTVSSGSLTVIGSSYPKDKLIRISSASVEEPNSVNLTASLASGVAGSGGLVVSLNVSPNFPSGYSIPSSVTIPVGQSSVNIPISTVSTGSTQALVYNINGIASGYAVSSGSLTVIGSSYPKDQIVYISSTTVVGNTLATIQASLLQVNSNDITVNVWADTPGFPNTYSVVGSNKFTIVIKAGTLYNTASVQTAADLSTHFYTLNGSASDGSLKKYVVSSGGLTVLGTNVDPNSIITINSRKVMEGTAIDMTASIPTTSHGNLDVLVSPNPAFPSNYKVKVNGAYVNNSNGFMLTIAGGQTSTVFTVETADDGFNADRSFMLNGTISNYYVVSGNLTVLEKSKSPLIKIKLTGPKAIICGGTPVRLNDYISSIIPVRNPDDYQRYYRYPGDVMVPINSSTTVSVVGTYTIYAINPSTGEVGTAQLSVTSGVVPVLSVTSPITHYSQVPVDLTDPSVTVGSTNVDHYNYYSDALGTLVLSNPKAITVAGTYYIQGIGPESCTSSIVPVVVIDGGPLTVELKASTTVLNEGDSGTFTLSLYDSGHNPAYLQKVETFVFTQDNSDGNTEKAGHCRISGNTAFPFTVDLAGGLDHVDLPIDALRDRILYNTELLVLEGTNADLGSVTSSMKIVDETSMDPNNLVITIGDGSIYYRGMISVTVSLPSGVTTAVPLDISLVQGSGSILSGVPAPVFPSDAFIGANSGVGYINVSGSNMRDDDVPAVLILEGSSTGFKVNPGTITIYNKRIHAFMSVSANGDNIHDYSEIQNIEKYLDNEVDIIDRWGVLVWRVKGYNNQDNVFRGRSNQGNGYDLPEGTYYYVIRFYDETGEINIFKGSLQLKRGTTGQ